MNFSVRVALVAVVLAGSAAEASDHRMKVGEVLLSNSGTTEQQYIELWDTAPGGETFPAATYQVTIFDTDATPVGTVVIGDIPTTNRYLLSTAMADADFGTTADTVLDVALPTVGSACFERAAGQPIHCLSWGCPNTPATAPSTSEGDAPADGMSLSVNEAGTGNGANDALYSITTPTPQEANVAGTESLACPASPVPDAGPATIDAGPPGNDAGSSDEPDNGSCNTTGRGGVPWLPALVLGLLFVRRRRN